jgi:hypothetical protein
MSQSSDAVDRKLTDETVWGKPRCTQLTVSRSRCQQPAILGSDRCSVHLDFAALGTEHDPRHR